MFNHPRRPYYIYADESVPEEVSTQNDRNAIQSRRFRRLLRELTRRKAEAKAQQTSRTNEVAKTS